MHHEVSSDSVTAVTTGAGNCPVHPCREAVEAGQPIEGAFSRNRSFSKKFKRYGRYVPAGQTG